MNYNSINTHKARLESDYFKSPKIWLFNSKDMYLYYYIIAGMIGSTILLLLVLSLMFPGSKSESRSTTSNQVIEATPSSDIPASASATSASEAQIPDENFLGQLKSAEEQPTYELKAQAYQLLLDGNKLSGTYLARAKVKHQEYARLFDTYSTQLQRAEDFMNKEYFSDAIRYSKELIAKGPILGTAYTGAQETLKKAYFKKIDYYLIHANLSQARQAIQEAEQGNVSAEDLAEYREKIKNLEMASH